MSKGDMIAGKLMNGEIVSNYKEGGNSMHPVIKHREPITLIPLTDEDKENLKKNDIVFCKVKGNYYTHKIKAIKGDKYLISNLKGRENGWIGKQKIFGKYVKDNFK